MSFNQSATGKGYAPGWFLKAADCQRETQEISASHAQVVTAANGGKYVPMGAFWPSNSSSAVKGIVYEDVDVTTGNMPGSVVTSGEVYLDRLPAAPESGVQSALEALGFKFTATAPAVTRPADGSSLAALTVTSVYGGASGKTTLTVSGYTLGAGESYVYKAASGTAPAATFGAILGNTWTALTNGATVSITNDYKVTVAVINAGGACVAAGNVDAVSAT